MANEVVNDDTRVTFRDRFRLPSGKTAYVLMGLLICYVLIRLIVTAAVWPFLPDEVITLTVASQTSAEAIWNSLYRAVDGQPPVFYLLERTFVNIFSSKQIALRLPAILAFASTLICVFAYLRKKNFEFIGFLCAATILLTSLFHTFAVNARPYSMVVCCIAFALVCYQRVPSPFWTVLLSLSLMLAQSLHYYALFSMIPLGVGEFVYFVSARRFRWPVWTALALGPVPLLFFRPLLFNFKEYYGTHFWAHYGLASIPVTYGSFFLTGGAFGFALVAVCATGILGARPLSANGISSKGDGRDPVEASLLLTLLLLPFPTALVIHLIHGAMLDRYVLASVLGVALSLACVMSLARERVVWLFAIFTFSTFSIHEFSFWRSTHSLRLDNPASPAETLLQKAGHPDLPVVVSDGTTYLQLAYYASPEWKKRFVFLEDAQKAVQYAGTDTVDKNLWVLQSYMPLKIDPLNDFVAANTKFLLYVDDRGGFNWLPGYFQEAASSVQVIRLEGSRKIYLVTMRDNLHP